MILSKNLIVLSLTLFIFGCSVSPPYDDLIKRGGLFYRKSQEEPFTGTSIGTEVGRFIEGKKEGLWTRWHKNGQLRSKGIYKNGRQDGIWLWYYKHGQLQAKDRYKNGILIESIEYYEEDGTLIK